MIEVEQNEKTDTFFEHFGVKGMHWGRRKAVAVGAKAKTSYNNLSSRQKNTVKIGGVAAGVALVAVGPVVAAGAAVATVLLTKHGKKSVASIIDQK